MLQAVQLGIASLSDVSAGLVVLSLCGSRHKVCLAIFLLLEPCLSERASILLLGLADSKSKLLSYICVTERPPARDMTILYKYSQPIVQAILVPFYPLSFFSSFITDTLCSVSISAAFHSFVSGHISITCSGKRPTPVLSAVENSR